MRDRLIIVRHGESMGDLDRSFYQSYPDSAVGLTERGIHQAIECGKLLRHKIEFNGFGLLAYCSQYFRTRQTARIVLDMMKAYHLEPNVSIYLNSRNPGRGGRPENMFRDAYIAPDEGESLADIRVRVSSWLEGVVIPYLSHSNTILFTHFECARAIIAHVLGLSDEEMCDVGVKFGEPRVFRRIGSKFIEETMPA